ncbi:uncharacterized protein TM35_000431740 [Trypanosoma theileri]|uniref:Uncharacterized protein n=1 Tax=Trypanosoma theileri TaxID=67003 RepID=A0A1X0NIW2_9TRYP|nr:uncharacterized protein TM35_000431740 [Trypanosoma theileri]ORC84606.1 hypothetical protein TM35_000431740 [Trypanosoma theileri]
MAEIPETLESLRAENAMLRMQLNARAPPRHDAADRLIAELQRSLWDVQQRNLFLEQESHAEHNAIKQAYEVYINKLEEELHRCQVLLKKYTTTTATTPESK